MSQQPEENNDAIADYVRRAEHNTARVPSIPEGIAFSPIKTAAVIGAGTMGSGIATNFLNAGVSVTLVDTNSEALSRGLATIERNLQGAVKRGLITEELAGQRRALVKGAPRIEDVSGVEIVIEAIFENLALKRQVFEQLGRHTASSTILATNTSTLDLNEIVAASGRPEKGVGLHFFSPAHVMKLLEIVRGRETSSETVAACLDLAHRMRKTGVVVGVGFGFVGNKMLLDGYFREVELMLLEGCSPADIDRAMTSFGFAMGPCAVSDMAGVDIAYLIRKELFQKETRPDPYLVVSDALGELGRNGMKSQKGFYRYDPSDRTPHPDAEVDALCEKLAADRGIMRRTFTEEEIVERCVLQLVNIGIQLIDGGLAARPSDIDAIWLNGYGFPRRRGGPMYYADDLGLPKVLERIETYHSRIGEVWRPSPLLKRLVGERRDLNSLNIA